MPTSELTEWIKWLLIIIMSIIMAWEKLKRWYFKRNGKDRRNANPHSDLSYELGQLNQAFKDHIKHNEKRTDEIKADIRILRENQNRHSTAIGVLKSKMQ